MTNKDKFLHSLHNARLEHTKWVSKMRLLAAGNTNDETTQHKSFYDTHFAKWFQEKASYLLFENGMTALKEIEKLLPHLDGEYTLLYNVAVKNRSKTILGKLKPMTRDEEFSADKYLKSIRLITEKIEERIEEVYNRLNTMHEDKFKFMAKEEDIPLQQEMSTPEPKKSPKRQSHVGARGACYDED